MFLFTLTTLTYPLFLLKFSPMLQLKLLETFLFMQPLPLESCSTSAPRPPNCWIPLAG